MSPDFTAAGLRVQTISARKWIYEDRIRLAYEHLAAERPRAVLACLGSDSFEVLRMVPGEVVRLGLIQSDDPSPYAMSRHFAGCLDGMLGVSESIAEKLRAEKAFVGKTIQSIPYGIQFSAAGERQAKAPGDPLRLIYVGRIIEEQKRVSRLVELARLLVEWKVNFEWVFAGSGPELDKTQAALKDVSQVRFLGNVPNAKVGELLRAQDVMVLLSDYEGLPLSLLEAMGEGVVPVISDLQSGIREVVTPETGIKVPIGDVATAAEAIRSLALDPVRLAALSAASRRFARREYSASRMADRYLDLIDSFHRPATMWPARMRVPTPLLVDRPWLFQGFPRRARRALKSITGA